MPHPQTITGARARHKIRTGFNKLTHLIAGTLGPRGRLVGYQSHHANRPPELLDDGALVARRFTGFPDRFETMGAFLARHLAWKMEEAVGDGSATAVVMACEILNQAERMIAAGHNAMRLRVGLEKGQTAILQALQRLAQPLEDRQRIIGLATAISQDEALGQHIEEIFDVVGAHGAVDVRFSYGRGHEREYIRGAFWNQGWVSSYFTTEAGTAILKKPALLFTNHILERADDLLPVLEVIQQNKARGSETSVEGLVVIAPVIQGEALNLLVTNKTRGALPTLAIKAPGLGAEKTEILHDLAALCGGRVFLKESADRLEDAKLTDLGRADEVQAIRSGFTLIGGKGRPATIRQRVAELRSQLTKAAYGRDRDRLIERSGKLIGGVALLKVGGATESEREYNKNRAEEAVRSVRLALDEGIVPGGGAALIATLPALNQLCLPEDEAAALPILRAALCAPLTTMLRNAGIEPAPIIAQVAASEPGTGYDILNERLTDMLTANIVDPYAVIRQAVQIGISGAIMALSIDAVVHKPRSNRSDEVDFDV